MKIEQLTKLFERMETPEYLEAVKEKMKEMKKEQKKENNKKYYENYKNRIREKNNIAGQERYENDEEFRQKRKQYNRERYMQQKQETSARFPCDPSRLDKAKYEISINGFLEANEEEFF